MSYVVFIIFVALVFDATNGAHDAANSVATVVATKVLTQRQAVLWAAVFNFVAFLVFGTAVAKTIGRGLVDLSAVNSDVILAALLGAICWNLITWGLGLPSSSSHALMGAYAGGAIAKAGSFGVIIASGWIKPIFFIFLAPIIGFLLSALFLSVVTWVLKKINASEEKVTKWSRKVQLGTAALYSLGHGGNDAQKTMGIITGLLFSAGIIKSFSVPFWVVISAHLAIAVGTLIGGWKIVKTMAHKIVKDINSVDGSCAETAGALSLFLSTYLGVPVSTTHVITGAIGGVGLVKGKEHIFWKTLSKIMVGWLLTIPAAASIAWGAYALIMMIKR